MPVDSMTETSRQWLEPLLSKMTDRPGSFTHSGRLVLSPTMRLSDGEVIQYRTVGRDGKGVAFGRFVPRVGSVPQGRAPSAPVRTPRQTTTVPYGAGIVMATSQFFQALVLVAEFHVELVDGFVEARMKEDESIATGVLTAAQASANRARILVGQTRLRRKKKAERRVRIHGYSRHV